MLVSKDIGFEAAHNLVNYNGRCENLHGHSWRMRVTIEAPVDDRGLAFDFVTLSTALRERIYDVLDHSYLNDVLPQSSAENLAAWAWCQLADLPLKQIIVWETADAFVVYDGPEQEARLRQAWEARGVDLPSPVA